MQLKSKYSAMKKMMEAKIVQLNEKKRLVMGDNVSLKAKYEVVSKFEKEVYDKYNTLNEMHNNKFNTNGLESQQKNKERNEIEACNKAIEYEIKHQTQINKDLEYEVTNTAKMEEMKQKEYDNSLKIRDDINKFKTEEFTEVDKRIKELNSISTDDPIIKIEYDKNIDYKKKIEKIEKDLIMAQFRVDELDMSNDFLIKKKQEMIDEKKKFIIINDELKREIEQKSQANEMRIQKKVKENNSEEIQKQQEDLKELIIKGDEFEKKFLIEYEKSRTFASQIIKNTIEIKYREQKKDKLMQVIDDKYKIIDDLKEKVDELKESHAVISDKLGKAKIDHEMLKNRNKLLSEEHASLSSKLEYVLKNFDTSSSLKKISMDDMRVLTQTNNLVNESVNHFVNKVGAFKSNQIPKNILEDYDY